MSDFVSTNNGRPADKAARIKRLIPNATKTTTVNGIPVVPPKISSATKSKFALRARFEKKSARCLETRSKIVPTKGPTMEYGNNTTAKPTAALNAFACRSGENNTKEARAL